MFSSLPHFEQSLAIFLFRGFGFVLSLLYVIYSIVILGQVRGLSKIIKTMYGPLVVAVSILQLVVAVTVFVLMIVFVFSPVPSF